MATQIKLLWYIKFIYFVFSLLQIVCVFAVYFISVLTLRMLCVIAVNFAILQSEKQQEVNLRERKCAWKRSIQLRCKCMHMHTYRNTYLHIHTYIHICKQSLKCEIRAKLIRYFCKCAHILIQIQTHIQTIHTYLHNWL